MAKISFRELLAQVNRWEAQEREEYVKFLRSTPHPDEPHWCSGEEKCVLCDLLAAKEAYEADNEEPWLGTDATLISHGYDRRSALLDASRAHEETRCCHQPSDSPWACYDATQRA